jgi:hypothetical protein
MVTALTTHRVLLATIRDKGYCPCPHCLIPKTNFDKMGLVHDARARIKTARTYFLNKVTAARTLIYKLGLSFTSIRVSKLLQDFSLVPTLVRARSFHLLRLPD